MLNLKIRFTIFALGILIFYFLHGIFQEKIMSGHYGEHINEDGSVGTRFSQIIVLLWFQSFFNFVISKVILIIKRQSQKDNTDCAYYAVSAVIYLLVMVSMYMALHWVSYPTEVVVKSAKPLAVMIMSVLFAQKSYSWIRYACVTCIVVGVSLFMAKEGETTLVAGSENRTNFGVLLLLVSLIMDGLLGAIQERIRSSNSPTGFQMMFAIYFWCSLILSLTLVATNEVKDFFNFAKCYPQIWSDIGFLVLFGCLGQTFLFVMIADFGSLATSVINTVRKFFTVLFSVFIFGNVLIPLQWSGAVLVFVGIFAELYYGKRS